MRILNVKKEGDKFNVFSDEELYAEIIFDTNNIEASLFTKDKTFRVERDSDKNLVLKENFKNLFTFDFDYIWGGAEIIADGVDTGYDVKGRWFKPGTRLIDAQDNDLIVAVKKGDGLEVSIFDDEVSSSMIVSTIYYHIYTSAGKMLSILAGSALR